jgi:amino acid transporter
MKRKIIKKKTMSVFSLVMINIIAVDSIRALPISAEYGWTLIFYYVAGALFFMIPSALTAAELTTGWPETGGVYVWVREALGKKWAFLVAWLLWVYNIIWYPTILSLLSSTLFYVFSPSLAENKLAVTVCIFSLYGLAMVMNLFGMRLSSLVSAVGSIMGTLFPIVLIISLGTLWIVGGHPLALSFDHATLIPNMSSFSQLAILAGMLFGMVGMEMSAVHAQDVNNPQRDYPRALLISTLVILLTSVLGSLAIAFVIPQDKINLAVAVIESFSLFFHAYHLGWMVPLIALCIIIGGFSGVSAWIIGPGKCMLRAAQEGSFPAIFAKKNRFDAPANMLLLQSVIFSVICLFFLFFPGFNAAYWLLTAMTAELAMIFYVFLFASLIILRFKRPDVIRSFRIPGGQWGAVFVGGIGILSCCVVFFLGLFPPSQIQISGVLGYEVILIGGITLFLIIPLVLYRYLSHAA